MAHESFPFSGRPLCLLRPLCPHSNRSPRPLIRLCNQQVKLGLSWLSDRAEHHRLAGTLVLHELAVAAPAVFNVHVKVFVEVIWNGIRDPKLHIRESAVAALQACLVLIEKRETRYRVQWYYRLFEQTKHGLARAAPVEIVHGSLLALGELVRHTGGPV